jgi:serine/threonine protein kinase
MSDTVVLPQSPLAGFRQGDIIAAKYRLDHELGRGAMGTVWAATHTTLGQRVAIKLISGEQARSPEARHRFSLEAKAAARLKSRHAVQVYDDGETPEGFPYIVMEYLEGETLEARLDRQKDLGLPEAVRITSHVGRALARAHARGIVHRDLKSGNVFIARTDDDELGWVAKVLDFGVAKLADMASASTTKTGTIVGTPLFMSPEQIRGASYVDHRADLYSLGMVFYNMVTGIHAFNGPSYSDVLVAICTEPLPDIREKAPWLPQTIGAWFAKACARELPDRFQSADEMIEALRDAAGAHSRLSRPSVPEDVSGPSGTLMGHVPPHAMATIQASAVNIEGSAPGADNHTLRSRTGPQQSGPERNSAPQIATLRPRRSTFSYVMLALSGAAFAALLVFATLALRWASAFVSSFGEPSPPRASVARATSAVPPVAPPPPPSVVDRPSVPTTEPAPTSEAPAAEVSLERPRTPPSGKQAPSGRSIPTKARANPSPEPPKPTQRPPAPDMGF